MVASQDSFEMNIDWMVIQVKGAIGTSMGSMIYIKKIASKTKQDCTKCREYLRTNPLCKLGRVTAKPRRCKWFVSSGINKPKPPVQKAKTMLEIIDSINKSNASKQNKFNKAANSKKSSPKL